MVFQFYVCIANILHYIFCVFHLDSYVSIGDGSVSNLNENLEQSCTTSDSGMFPFSYLVIAK